jgi:hypothetical protein
VGGGVRHPPPETGFEQGFRFGTSCRPSPCFKGCLDGTIQSPSSKVSSHRLINKTAYLITITGSVKLVAMKLVAKKRVRESLPLSDTQASRAVNYSLYIPHSTWFKGKEVVSQNLDACPIGSWIFANSHINVSFISLWLRNTANNMTNSKLGLPVAYSISWLAQQLTPRCLLSMSSMCPPLVILHSTCPLFCDVMVRSRFKSSLL